MIPEEIYERIIRYAVKAPSQLNTQPWHFEVESGVIHLLPDLSRSLPVSDPYNTNLYISMGCVLENLELASRHLGYKADHEIVILPNYSMVKIKIREGIVPDHSRLFEHIRSRQVVETKFMNSSIDEILIERYADESKQKGISIYPLLQKDKYEKITALILKGIQFMNIQQAYAEEVIPWIRFSEKQAMQKGDGIRAASLDLPFSNTFLSRLLIKRQLSTKNEVRRWKNLIEHSSGLVLFTAKENEPDQWIRLGTSLQRFVLNLTRSGISYSHIPYPLEYILMQKKLAGLCGINENFPLQLIRIGRGKPVPYSFRRNIKHNVYINL